MDVTIKSQTPEGNGICVLVEMPAQVLTGDAVPQEHAIYIPTEAITNRMAVYGLASEDAAIEAIVKEHATRLNDLPPDSSTADEHINQMGGLRTDVVVTTAAAVVTEGIAK